MRSIQSSDGRSCWYEGFVLHGLSCVVRYIKLEVLICLGVFACLDVEGVTMGRISHQFLFVSHRENDIWTIMEHAFLSNSF